MARDSSGTYSRTSGHPVTTGTTINSSEFNSLTADIATEITDSLSRSGKGAMLAPIEATNGTAAAPSITFDSDTDSGLYRIGANNVGAAVAGAKVLDISATGLGVTGTTLSGDGTVSLPGIGFVSDTNSGLYRIGADNIGVAVNGAKVLDIAAATTGIANNVALTGANPASTTGFTDTLTPTNIPKAWGYVTTDGAGNFTVAAGFNVTSVATSNGSNLTNITLADDMGSANYCVLVTPGWNGYAYVSIVGAGVFTLASGATNLCTTATSFHFVAFGAQ